MADAFEHAVLRLLSRIGPGESISPAEAAREAAHEVGGSWENHLKEVRRAAVKLALEGRAVILLKGEMVDPEHFRGIYRIGSGEYFTPRKTAPAYKPPPPPLTPAGDYKPAPRPYTPPPTPSALAPPRAPAPAPSPAPAPAATRPPARVTVRVSPPVRPAVPPPAAKPAPPTQAPAPAAAIVPPPPVSPEPVAPAHLEPQHLYENEPEEAPVTAGTGWAADEGKPVTRFEFDPRGFEEDLLDEEPDEDGPHFPGEADAEDDMPSPLPPLAPSLSFDDDDYEDEDAGRAPQSATLDDIASQLERYLAAELNNPARGNAEIGDDIVRLPRQQDE